MFNRKKYEGISNKNLTFSLDGIVCSEVFWMWVKQSYIWFDLADIWLNFFLNF